MKTIFHILFFVLFISNGFAQDSTSFKVNSVEKNILKAYSYKITEMPIEDALLYIARRSNISLAYSKDILPHGKKITLDLSNSTIDEAFANILKGTGTSAVSLSKKNYVITSDKFELKANGSIRGLVTDSTNGEALAFGNVLINELNRGASTDSRGYFLITALPAPAEYTVSVSYVGYKPRQIKVTVVQDKVTHVDIPLVPSSIELQTVEKIGERIAESNATDIGLQRISVKDLEKLPQGVETDIFRSLQYVPGVKSTGDISARFFVRGSPSNQNLILLNDVPVYHPFHALGMFSAIDPEMINNIEFYKGGFTSEYAGRLSSVMRLITKDGNKLKYAAKASASLLTGKMLVEGPIDHGSFIFTGRKSYNNDVLKKFLNDKNVPIDFYDLSFKLNYANDNIIKDSKFTLFGFISDDDLINKNPNESDFKWSNKLLGFKWFQLSDSPLFYEVSFSISNFDGEVIPNLSSVKRKKNSLTDITLQMDFKYVYDTKDELNIGLKIQEVSSELLLENSRGTLGDISGPKGANISVYAKYKFLRFDNFGVDIGSRVNLTRIATGSAGTYFFEPRTSFTYRPFAELAIKGAWGVYNQEIITLSDEDELITIFEPWFITPSYIPPSRAIHYVAGIESKLSKEISVEIEGYYKNLLDFSALNDNKIFDTDPDLVNGRGESYGAEFQLNYQPFPFRFTAGYSLSWAFKEANNLRYNPRYDSRHSVNLSFEYNIGNGWYTSFVWVYYSGLPFTQILGYEDKLFIDDIFSNEYIFTNYKPFTINGLRNAARLPDYHRMDINITKNIKIGFSKLYFNLSLINIYNRENIFYFEKNTGKRINMLPFLPTASVKLEI